MNDTINTLRDFWDYFKSKKSYEILLRTIPLYIVVGIIIAVMTFYALFSIAGNFDASYFPNTSYMTNEQLLSYANNMPYRLQISLLTYFGLILLTVILLAAGIQNSVFNSTKNHVLGKDLPSVGETFSNSFRGYGRFLGYQFVYVFLPLLAVVVLLIVTELIQFTFIVTIISSILSFYFYSKLLRIENGDYLIPVILSVISIALSFVFMITDGTGVIRIIVYIILLVFGLFTPMIMIFSLLKENDFREGIKYE